jgi:hypothetical protein
MAEMPFGAEIENARDHRFTRVIVGVSLCRTDFNRTVVIRIWKLLNALAATRRSPALMAEGLKTKG